MRLIYEVLARLITLAAGFIASVVDAETKGHLAAVRECINAMKSGVAPRVDFAKASSLSQRCLVSCQVWCSMDVNGKTLRGDECVKWHYKEFESMDKDDERLTFAYLTNLQVYS